jgi:N utilization substance protein B
LAYHEAVKSDEAIMDDNFIKCIKINQRFENILNEAELAKEFVDKTPNWDSRIAEVDTILKMAICEF